MSDRAVRHEDLDDATRHAALEAEARAAGWPRVTVGASIVVDGEAAWQRALAEASDVALVALAGALKVHRPADSEAPA